MANQDVAATEANIQRALNWMASFGEELGWFQGMELTGLTLRKADWGWKLVVTANSQEGPVVAFIEGRTPVGALRNLYESVRNPGMTWHKDKYR